MVAELHSVYRLFLKSIIDSHLPSRLLLLGLVGVPPAAAPEGQPGQQIRQPLGRTGL